MHLTARQIEKLQAAGRKRVEARIHVLLGAGRISASAFARHGADLLRAADGKLYRYCARRARKR